MFWLYDQVKKTGVKIEADNIYFMFVKHLFLWKPIQQNKVT